MLLKSHCNKPWHLAIGQFSTTITNSRLHCDNYVTIPKDAAARTRPVFPMVTNILQFKFSLKTLQLNHFVVKYHPIELA